MNWLVKPSLGRRLVLTLALTFVVCSGVVLLAEYLKFRKQVESSVGLRTFGRVMSGQIESIGDDDRARAFVSQMVLVLNRVRHDNDFPLDPMLLQLYRRDGTPAFTTDGAPPALLAGATDHVTTTHIGERVYSVYATDTARWSLRVAEPRIPDGAILLLLANSIWPDMVMTFPIVLLPVWFAVFQGLKPLRRLSAQMAARSPDDLSPIGFDLKYIELRPVVTAFDSLLAKLRRKVQRERAFVQDAAHELRTPMAVIAAQAHVLAKAESVEQRQVARQALDDAISRTSHLTHQLLALATLDGVQKGFPEEIDLARLLQQMLAGLTPSAILRGIELSLDAPDSLQAGVDTAAFRSVVENLLDNALRYVPRGGSVAVSLQENAEGIQLRVADDGPGIDPQDRPHIFDRFYRGRGHDLPGTGLGLSIVWKAAEAMGGTIHLETGLEGRGVAFVLQLPRGA